MPFPVFKVFNPWIRWIGGIILLMWTGCASPESRLSGDYHSNWGRCIVEVRGQNAVIRYPRGVMTCQVEEPQTLRCTWKSGEATGKALLRGQTDRTLRGSWGYGASESDGGAWVLAR